jgi:hypothetical protein
VAGTLATSGALAVAAVVELARSGALAGAAATAGAGVGAGAAPLAPFDCIAIPVAADCDTALAALAVAGADAAPDTPAVEVVAVAELAATAALDVPEVVPETASDATAAPVASSDGIVSTAPSRNRLGSCAINAFGFASKRAFEARTSVARSCDCVAAIATSLSDCPG